VRLRPIAALSAAAVAVLLLAGCASGQGTAQPTGTAAADLCAAQAKPGKASDSVKVDGEVGKPSKATFEKPLEPKALQVSVLDEGTGDAVKPGDFVSYAMTAYNAKTGEELATVGYKPGEFLPSQLSAATVLGQVFGCGKIGERVVAAFPASDTAQSEVYVLDLLGTVPTAAWGEPQAEPAGLPKVKLADNGAPTITIPEGQDPPTATEVATLKKGDGYKVQQGDYTLIQYTGVRWSDVRLHLGEEHSGDPHHDSGRQGLPEGARGSDRRIAGARRHPARRGIRRGQDQRGRPEGRDAGLRRRHPRSAVGDRRRRNRMTPRRALRRPPVG